MPSSSHWTVHGFPPLQVDPAVGCVTYRRVSTDQPRASTVCAGGGSTHVEGSLHQQSKEALQEQDGEEDEVHGEGR